MPNLALGLLLAAFLAITAHADPDPGGPGSFQSACFHGQNDADTPATLSPCDSPDILNVESNLNGTAIMKRRGFQEDAALTCSTCPVTGSHSFIDSSGNRLDIICQNRYCAKKTNGNAPVDFLTAAASSATRWSFVDQAGILYGGNNAYDPIIKYDGTTLSRPSGMPKGAILELTQDRLVVADIQSLPNRVHYSSAGAFENFTTGLNPEDSYFDDIGAPGDKTRGLKHLSGVLHIFKTASITGCELGDQYTSRCAVISPNIGTTDPNSIITAGSSMYFRAQDKSYWELSSSGLNQISKKIPNLVKSQSGGLGGGENTNTQTTQADWQAGVQNDTGTFDTVTIPGSIFPSSNTAIWTSSTDFAGGTSFNLSTAISGALFMVQPGSSSFKNASIETDGTTNWNGAANITRTDACEGFHGTYSWTADFTQTCGEAYLYVYVKDTSSNTLYTYRTLIANEQAVTEYAFNITTVPASMVYLNFVWPSGAEGSINTAPFVHPETISFRAGDQNDGGCGVCFDVWEPASYITSASFTSDGYNTSIATPTWGQTAVSMSSSTSGSINFMTRVSATSNGTYDVGVAVANGSRATSLQKQYIKSVSSFTIFSATNTAPVLYSVDVPFVSTGTFRTQCIQPNSSISAWGSLSCAETLAGNGSIVYYATSAATCGSLPTSAPVDWQTSVTNGATLSIATNTAVYIGWRSLMGSTTDQAEIDACVLAWNEGTPAQPVWAAYDSVNNSIFWTTTVDNAAYANRLLKYDRNLQSWYPWDIKAQAPRIINNSLYFGSPSSGTWNLYGLTDADNGASINGYWTTKDFGSDKPFQEKDFKTISMLLRNNLAGTLTATYTFSNAETGSYTVSLSTGAGINYARYNENLPATSPQNFLKLRIGNNSSTPFELLGIGADWEARPWSVTGP